MTYVPGMTRKRALEQHIAVFGEGGSGKTVLVPSFFYGATQEPQYRQEHVFHVLADKLSEGTRLHRNHLGMRDHRHIRTAKTAVHIRKTLWTRLPGRRTSVLTDELDRRLKKVRGPGHSRHGRRRT